MEKNCARSRRSLRLAGMGGLIALAAGGAEAVTLDFNDLVHGEIVSGQYLSEFGVTITAINPSRPFSLAAAFDTNRTGTADPDLEGPDWAFGNIGTCADLGNILIIAENDIGAG